MTQYAHIEQLPNMGNRKPKIGSSPDAGTASGEYPLCKKGASQCSVSIDLSPRRAILAGEHVLFLGIGAMFVIWTAVVLT